MNFNYRYSTGNYRSKKLKYTYFTFEIKNFQEYTEGSNNVGNLTFSGNFKATQMEE